MRGPSLSRRAYITITIGTLLLSGAFLVLSIDYANTTGVFYLARNTPIIHFTNELEALTSLLYSLPEDASVEYRGPYSCSWNQLTGKFVCEGGLEIENVSAAVTFTKDERMLYTPRTACIYFSFGAIAAIAGKLTKANVIDVPKKYGKEFVEEVGEEMAEEISKQLSKKTRSRIRLFFESMALRKTNFMKKMRVRLHLLGSLDPSEVKFIRQFSKTKDEVRHGLMSKIGKAPGFKDPSTGKLVYPYTEKAVRLGVPEDELETAAKAMYVNDIMTFMENNPERAMRYNAIDLIESTGDDAKRFEKNLKANWGYELTKAQKEIDEFSSQSFLNTKLVSLEVLYIQNSRGARSFINKIDDGKGGFVYRLKDKFEVASMNVFTPAVQLAESKVRYSRNLLLWARTAAKGIAAYESCRSDDLFWEIIDYFTGNQLLIQVDLDSADHFYDFYAGKYGAVTIDFSDGEDEIKAVKSYATNGEDMCFLRNQLSYFGGNYTTQPLKMEDGNIILSKNKETFDTMCTDEQEYYPIGVGEIADYARKACSGANQEFDVYVTPARLFSNRSGMLCESHFARNEEGEAQGTFDIFCYDFADIACPVDIKFDNLTINYTMKEGEIVNLNILDRVINPSLADLEESANTYWFKHTSYLLPGVTIDMPLIGDILKFVFGLFGQESPLDTLSNALNTIIPEVPMGSRSLELKEGFPQSMYYRCSISAERYRPIPSQPYHVRLVSSGCEPVLLMNWNDILTDEYKCGDGVCAVDENAANCELDCPAPVCLVPTSCPGCTEICSSEGLGTAICVPFGELLPSPEGWIAVAPCTSIVSGLPVEGLCYCESGG